MYREYGKWWSPSLGRDMEYLWYGKFGRPVMLFPTSGGRFFENEDFKLTNGMTFNLPNRWTAHLVKEDNRWLVSGFHVSANVFDNPVLHLAMRRAALWAGGAALAAGLLLGVVGTKLADRRRGRQP